MERRRNRRGSSSILPAPTTTDSRGSSAMSTGTPVSLLTRASRFRNSAPPPGWAPRQTPGCRRRRYRRTWPPGGYVGCHRNARNAVTETLKRRHRNVTRRVIMDARNYRLPRGH